MVASPNALVVVPELIEMEILIWMFLLEGVVAVAEGIETGVVVVVGPVLFLEEGGQVLVLLSPLLAAQIWVRTRIGGSHREVLGMEQYPFLKHSLRLESQGGRIARVLRRRQSLSWRGRAE